MAVVLVVKPYGLLGTPPSTPPTTPIAEFRTLVIPPSRRAAMVALALFALAALLPFTGDEYRLVLATDILVLALFASSLQFLMGTGGMASFGHAAYFGLGAYAAALCARHGWPMEFALLAAPLVSLAGALVFGWFCVRLSGVYLAMLTLAFAQIVWSIVCQWDSVTGGSNGVVGVWPAAWLADKRAYFWFTLILTSAALAAIAWIAHTPLGYSLRAGRDSALRAEAIGIDVRRTQWAAFALAGAFAGLAGGLYAFSKGSISPETLAIPAIGRCAGDGAARRPQCPGGAVARRRDVHVALGHAIARDGLLAREPRRRDPADRPRVPARNRRCAAAALRWARMGAAGEVKAGRVRRRAIEQSAAGPPRRASPKVEEAEK